MADKTLRQRIVDRIVGELVTINDTNGYLTNIGEHCWRWKANEFAPEETPGCNVMDSGCRFTPQVSGHDDWDMDLIIEIAGNEGTDTPQFLIQAEADIYKAIGKISLLQDIGLSASRILPVESEFSVKQDTKILSGVRMKFLVHFRTKQWDPFTP